MTYKNSRFQFLVEKIEGDQVWLEGNHKLAGKPLNFEVELTKIIRIPKPGEPYSSVQ